MTDKVQKIREEVEIVVNRRLNLLNGDYFNLNEETDGLTNEIMDIIDSMQEEPTSVWHDAKDTPVASKTKIVLYTNGKWDMFKAYETKDDYDNYWAGVNQALEEKGVLVKRWAYVEDLLKL